MALEIERKFLVESLDFLAGIEGTVAKQGYIAMGPPASVRVRIMGEQAQLNMKEFTEGLARQEFEYPIPLADGEALLQLCAENVLEKTRYFVTHDKHVWEVDVFSGANDGLVVAEIELVAEEEVFEQPDWLGEEVTGDVRYYNSSLTQNPYSQW